MGLPIFLILFFLSFFNLALLCLDKITEPRIKHQRYKIYGVIIVLVVSGIGVVIMSIPYFN